VHPYKTYTVISGSVPRLRAGSGLKRASIFLYNVRVGESGMTYFGRESRVDSDTRPSRQAGPPGAPPRRPTAGAHAGAAQRQRRPSALCPPRSAHSRYDALHPLKALSGPHQTSHTDQHQGATVACTSPGT
jgi:hypothetical protein